MQEIYEHLEQGFERALHGRDARERRIGAELKFPMVNPDGASVSYETVHALWEYLQKLGWEAVTDDMSGKLVGARKPGPQNHTLASCETGFSKSEFSLAHVSDLFELEKSIRELRRELEDFAQQHEVCFMGYGIQPVTPPGEHLLMEKSRTSVWDRIFPSNDHIPEERGDDFHLFTINAASHVHLSVGREEAIPLVNVLNGFSPAQIALTANSSVWRDGIDEHECVAEKFWDWWMPEEGRVGIPRERFEDLRHYADEIGRFRPVYVKREGTPIVLDQYESFAEYYKQDEARGLDPEGCEVEVVPRQADVDLHSTCYWFNARLSRYYTVEGRLCDQQPPNALICVAALTLGLASALEEGREVIDSYSWQDLRDAREEACMNAIDGTMRGASLAEFCNEMLDVAELGLKRRALGEELFLEPLQRRVRRRTCPARNAERIYRCDGVEALVEARSL
jgi:gamma-glutamylcysteine synthetase